MTRLLLLYPRAWRERYLDEVADLLAEDPPTVADRLDLLRGALDAWLHPQVVGPAARSPEGTPRPVAVTTLTMLGGLLWVAGGLVQHVGGIDPLTGYKVSTGVVVVVAALVVSSLAAIARAWSSPAVGGRLRRPAAAMLAVGALMFLPWPILVIGFWGHLIATMGFGAVLGASGDRTGGFLVVAALVAAMFNTESALALAVIPLGLAWMVVGLGAVRRTVPTPAPAA